MIDPRDHEAAQRALAVLAPLTVHAIACVESHSDRLAMRVALTMLLDRVKHPDDDLAAARLVKGLREQGP